MPFTYANIETSGEVPTFFSADPDAAHLKKTDSDTTLILNKYEDICHSFRQHFTHIKKSSKLEFVW